MRLHDPSKRFIQAVRSCGRAGLPLMRRRWISAVCLSVATAPLAAAQRFPRPDFKSDYVSPDVSVPAARALAFEALDAAALVLALALAARLALRTRSRRGLVVLALFSLAYFGFWRRGCVCSVGSVQNLALGLTDPGYAIPLGVIVFFALPLLWTLFCGRTFCAAVCPLGAVQELVLWRPVRTPAWMNHILDLIPFVYLSVAVLFAATGAGFLICRLDPFIGFFRLGATVPLLALGAAFLAVGVFIGRPYCRLLCPYGALLGVMSRVSRRHVTITPDTCVHCRLCEDACPYGAIRKPLPAAAPEARGKGVRRLAAIAVAIPLTALAAVTTGYVFGNLLSQAHPRVALALEVSHADENALGDMSLERQAFFTSGLPNDALYAEARSVQRRFAVGGALLGAWLALVAIAKLVGLSIWRSRTDYEPDRGRCFSCARCFTYCPVERKRKRTAP